MKKSTKLAMFRAMLTAATLDDRFRKGAADNYIPLKKPEVKPKDAEVISNRIKNKQERKLKKQQERRIRLHGHQIRLKRINDARRARNLKKQENNNGLY